MLAFALRRLFVSVPILIVSTFVVFVMVSLSANPLTPLIARNPPPPLAPSNSNASGCISTSRFSSDTGTGSPACCTVISAPRSSPP